MFSVCGQSFSQRYSRINKNQIIFLIIPLLFTRSSLPPMWFTKTYRKTSVLPSSSAFDSYFPKQFQNKPRQLYPQLQSQAPARWSTNIPNQLWDIISPVGHGSPSWYSSSRSRPGGNLCKVPKLALFDLDEQLYPELLLNTVSWIRSQDIFIPLPTARSLLFTWRKHMEAHGVAEKDKTFYKTSLWCADLRGNVSKHLSGT